MKTRPVYRDTSFEALFPFRILEFEGADCASAPHWHGCMEIMCIVKGAVTVIIGGESYKARKDDIVTLSPGIIHSFHDPSGDALVHVFLFGYEMLSEDASDIYNRMLRETFYKKQIFNAEDGELYRRSRKLFEEILDEYRRGETGFKMVIRAKLMEAEVLYFRSIIISRSGTSLDEQKPKNIGRLERVFEYIHGNFNIPELSVQHAAEAAGVSVNYFVRFFRRQSGQHFHDYLARLRLSYAKRELLSSDRPVTDIAYDCGFNSIQTFNRLFKVHTGLTPLAFRNNKQIGL
ncbi:MAG: AraC family transcriptional regulator [Treponema sp.]|nr:AraC family transcriptional regulator [Treponema sp.]